MKFKYFVGVCLMVFSFWNCKSQSTDILEAFSLMNAKLEISSPKKIHQLDSLLQISMSDTIIKGDFKRFKRKSQMLDSLIADIKEKLIVNIGLYSNYSSFSDTDFEKMDKKSVDSILFLGDKASYIGQNLLYCMSDYKTTFVELYATDYPEITRQVQQKFNVKNEADIDWLIYHYRGFPMVAALTKLTQMWVDLQSIEQELLEALLIKQ